MKKLSALALALIAVLTLGACGDEDAEPVEGDTYLELNPYDDVTWEDDSHVLSNLHSHTQNSDGDYTPAEVVDMYHDGGYGALAITDHDDDVNNTSADQVVYPWTEFEDVDGNWDNRDPDELDMISVAGSELSYNHHMVALFTDYRQPNGDDDEMTTLQNAFDSNDDAIAFMAHPGRYWEHDEEYEEGDNYAPEWYLDFFDTFEDDELLGIEVYNRNDEYMHDRLLWDKLLTESMPERPIWGFANDDYHGYSPDDPGYSKIYALTADASDDAEYREALINGEFYAQHTSEPMGEGPTISNVTIDETKRTISIEVDGEYDRIRWLSGYDEESNLSGYVDSGDTFEYAEFDGNYVRAEIISGEGTFNESQTLLQPFGFVQDPDREE